MKRLLANTLLIVFSITISIILAEFALRPFYPSSGTSYFYRIPHETLGWKLQPGADFINYIPEASIQVRYNSDGWRDTEHQLQKKTGDSLRIAVLGDSFMEGYSVELKDSFHKRLETRLNQLNANAEVINFGVGGYGTLQEYITYRDYASAYKPDIVIVGFYLGNDLVNNAQHFDTYKKKGSFKMKATRPYLDQTNQSEWNVIYADYKTSLKRYREQKESFFKKVIQTSALNRALKLQKSKAKLKLGANRIKIGEERNLRNYGVHFCSEPEEFSQAWQTTERILDRLNTETRRNGAKLVIFSVPAMHEVDNSMVERIATETSGEQKACMDTPPGYQRLERLTNKLGIRYVNLLSEFRDASDGVGSTLFNLSDRHWNKAGHSLATENVYKYLEDAGLIEAK
ncbi:SGNH/GDSL hydrolase family protein [Solemya elarraichensis gill symbiont]|uniref:SGNH hydrolase-type esterase domain-containing protein n=1 Tax=Solemya elarraichensis gill symbiont TaxID=1918949 RepID=A0A1T2LC89_9GAMM|nr:SGNH/GDSL hydrolase family protein [Solemya elarraichensis gill symbiont]OOZ42725.1 hypothetical protein BOW52_01825 [Solemya elarraichensis gill symbiont]